MAVNVIDLMEQGIKRAQQARGTGALFFTLKSGEKALVRPLINLNQAVVAHKHELFNKATGKYEVSALCAKDYGQDCLNCESAKTNKKLTAYRFFVVPVYVYRVIDAKTGKAITYQDQEGNEQEITGIRFLQLKDSNTILQTLLAHYREEGDIRNNDFVIVRQGEKLETVYTCLPKAAKPFTVQNLPEQTWDGIRERLAELCPYEAIEDLSIYETAGLGGLKTTSAATSPQQQKAVEDVPEF